MKMLGPQAGEDYQDDAGHVDEEDWEDWEERAVRMKTQLGTMFDEEQEDEYADESEDGILMSLKASTQMSPKMSTKKSSQIMSMKPTARSRATIRLLQAPVKTARAMAMQTLYRQPAPSSSCHLAIVSLRVIPRPIAMGLRSS